MTSVPLPRVVCPDPLSGFGRRLRVALYSHDTQGLGHIRRNLRIARELQRDTETCDVLLLTGVREAGLLALPDGADLVVLPGVSKAVEGRYGPRALRSSLSDVVALRYAVLTAPLEEFAPDVLIVDKVARGFGGELEEALCRLRNRTRCVLGLRDILDDPATVRREWAVDRTDAAIREFYDAVWVYGDARVFDVVQEYGLSADIAAKLVYTGYLAPQPAALKRRDGGRTVACLVGGGQDGFALLEAFLQADAPDGTALVAVTGPFLPPAGRRYLERLAAERPDRHLYGFVEQLDSLLDTVDGVVTMGGYNSVAEALGRGLPTLVVPRIYPRLEQFVRAERLAALGVCAVLHPDQLSPDAVSAWLAAPHPTADARSAVDLDGLRRIPLLSQTLTSPLEAEHAAG